MLRAGKVRPATGGAAKIAKQELDARNDLQSSLVLAVKDEVLSEEEEQHGAAKVKAEESTAEHSAKKKKPSAKAQALATLKRLLDEASPERLVEVMALQKAQLDTIDKAIASARADEEAEAEQVCKLQEEFQNSTKAVREALEEEKSALKGCEETGCKKQAAALRTAAEKVKLHDVQDRLRMAERLAVTAKKMKEFKEQRKASAAAKEAANQKHKDVLASTKAALNELKYSSTEASKRSPFALALGLGKKRAASNVEVQTPDRKHARQADPAALTPCKEEAQAAVPQGAKGSCSVLDLD